MPKRTGRRCVQNSHSIKKILRRNGGNVNCSKNKRKKALHPGKEKSGNNTPAIRRAAREARRNPEPDAMETDDKAKKKEPAATAARREARQAIGKQLRGGNGRQSEHRDADGGEQWMCFGDSIARRTLQLTDCVRQQRFHPLFCTQEEKDCGSPQCGNQR